MEIIEVKRNLMGIVGDLAYPKTKLSDFIFDENLSERKRCRV